MDRKFLSSFCFGTDSYYSIFSFLKVYEMYIFIKFCLDVLKKERFRIKKKKNHCLEKGNSFSSQSKDYLFEVEDHFLSASSIFKHFSKMLLIRNNWTSRQKIIK